MIIEIAARLRENVQKVIIGKDEVIDLALVAILCEGHILLEDVPGIGKTTLARALSTSLGCAFLFQNSFKTLFFFKKNFA